MSSFSQLAGQILGGQSEGEISPILQVAQQPLAQQGGLPGLLEKFGQSGLDEHVASWVGTGENMPVDASQIASALGQGPLADLAGRFGIDSQQLAGGLAQALPALIDQLTPNGQVEEGDTLSQGLSALSQLLSKPQA